MRDLVARRRRKEELPGHVGRDVGAYVLAPLAGGCHRAPARLRGLLERIGKLAHSVSHLFSLRACRTCAHTVLRSRRA